MKQTFVVILILFVQLALYAQNDTIFLRYNANRNGEKLNYKIDTVISNTAFPPPILYGSRILPWTKNQQKAKGFGLELENIVVTPCRPSFTDPTIGGSDQLDLTSIQSIELAETNWTVELKIFENCCQAFLCDLGIENDSILNLMYYSYGSTYCDCDCCFGLTYNIKRSDYENNKKARYVMINRDSATLRKLNMP